LKTLTKFIEPDNLPKKYGGNLDWDFGSYPDLDDETRALVGHLADDGKFTKGPIRYISGESGDQIIAVGTENGKERRTVLSELPPTKASNGTATATKEEKVAAPVVGAADSGVVGAVAASSSEKDVAPVVDQSTPVVAERYPKRDGDVPEDVIQESTAVTTAQVPAAETQKAEEEFHKDLPESTGSAIPIPPGQTPFLEEQEDAFAKMALAEKNTPETVAPEGAGAEQTVEKAATSTSEAPSATAQLLKPTA
jgi:hypothetical protein